MQAMWRRGQRGWQSLVLYGRALRLLWQAAPSGLSLLAGLMIVQGVIPPLGIWLFKEIIDTLSSGTWHSSGWSLLAIWGTLAILGQLTQQWIMLVQASLNERCTAAVEHILIRKANSLPDLAAFEDPAFYDQLQTLTRLAAYRPLNVLTTTVQLIPNMITSAGLLLLIGGLVWWLPLILVGATLPLGAANMRLQRQSWQTTVGQGPLTRAMRYFTTLATTDTHAKEVRVLGFGSLLEDRYWAAFEQLHRESSAQRRNQAHGPFGAALLFAGAAIFSFWWIVNHAIQGSASIGDVVLMLQSLAVLQQYLGGIAASIALLKGHLLFFQHFFEFQAYRSPLKLAEPGIVPPTALQTGIQFDQVSYRYPNGTQALEQISFTLHPGECVALVGENGAGKTTLVKLLCRLYDPSSGTIQVDGHHLRTLDLQAWREQVGAVFQDFGRYHLTVAENIALGKLSKLDDLASIELAGTQAGFTRHVAGLATGYTTQLGGQWGGVDLSGGQWQTLGIARALIRDAQILILDEPTAALDPRAEYELFQRFRELAQGKTTLLITHRLTSVAMADRILVLKAGRLVEQGTQRELLAQQGEYAELYRLQHQQNG